MRAVGSFSFCQKPFRRGWCVFELFFFALSLYIFYFFFGVLPFLASSSNSNNNYDEKIESNQRNSIYFWWIRWIVKCIHSNCVCVCVCCANGLVVLCLGKRMRTLFSMENVDSITVRGIAVAIAAFAFVSSFSIIDKSPKITSLLFFYSAGWLFFLLLIAIHFMEWIFVAYLPIVSFSSKWSILIAIWFSRHETVVASLHVN